MTRTMDREKSHGAEEALRQRELVLHAMAESIPDPLFIKDRDSRMVMANAATAHAIGKPIERIVGHTDAEFYDDPAVAAAMMANDRRIMETGEPQMIEEFVPSPSGMRTYLSFKTPWRDADGRIIGVIGSARDITEQKRAEAALRESEGRLRAFFEQAAVGTAVANPATGRFTDANSKYCEITGYSLPELLTIGIWDVTHPEDRLVDYDRYHRLVTGEAKEYLADKRYVRKDGRVIWVHVAVGMVRDEQGRATQSVGVIQDITDQKRAEAALRESEAGLAAAQRLAHIGSWEWDVRNDTARWSDETFRIFGEPSVPLRPEHHRSFLDTLHPDDRQRVDQALADALTGARDYNLEYRIVLPDGTEKVIDAQAEVMRDTDGKPLSMRGTVHDVTERKRWEEQIKAAHAAAEQANRAKDQFIAALSHELRTPLTPVLAAASYLKVDPRLPTDARDDLAVIHRNIDLETRLIDDLLDLTRIAQSKIDLRKRPVDLAHVLREAARICSPELDVRSQQLTIETPCEPYPMLADAARLHQLFWNLLKNAIKFSPEHGTISVRACRADGSVIVEVSDAGIGIDPQLLTRIFSPFEQGEQAVTRRFGGLGLGLTICKSVAEMHGGSIRAQSDGRDKGATFTVQLPLSPEVEGDLPAVGRGDTQPLSEKSPPNARPLRVLLVEDHVDTARMIARLLRTKGYQVGTAGTVAEALEAIKRGAFDVLLSDLGLPDGSGCDLMRQVAAQGCPIKGIALSGYGTSEDVEKSLRAGFLAHLVKPVSFQNLQDALLSVAYPGT